MPIVYQYVSAILPDEYRLWFTKGDRGAQVIKKRLKLGLGVLAFSLLLSTGFGSVLAAPATFTVTNTNDSGAGSLRQAILDANSNGNAADMDVIEFDIAGSEVHAIDLDSDLPYVTEKVTIDGFTQTGASANTAASPSPLNGVIKIEIRGTDATITQGIIGLVADDSVLKGVSVYDGSREDATFSNPKANVALVGGGTKVQGSYIGLRADGTTKGADYKNTISVLTAGSNTVVGGENAADRNVIHGLGNSNQAATVAPGSGTTSIYGNYIGIAKDGVTDLTPNAEDANGLSAPFGFGVNLLSTDGTVIGGSTSARRNVISGNDSNVIISSPGNVVQGNYIGTDYTGQPNTAVTNGMGITVTTGTNSLIGGTGAGEGNIIAGVLGSGIEISEYYIQPIDYTLTANNVAALGNKIYSVKPFSLLGVGNANMGIDISKFQDNTGDFLPDAFTERGPNQNDAGDVDTGGNGKINTAVLKTAQQVDNKITITYDLDVASSPSNSYRVEFFANNESTIFGYGPGELYIGAAASDAPGNNKTVEITVDGSYVNKSLSATVTAIDGTTQSGYGATSEFSKNISIGSATDFDSDGAVDSAENAGPNNGDANDDGIQDKDQPTVTTFVLGETGIYSTFVTEGCSENGTVASIDASTFEAQDELFEYPYGLTDFTLNCSRGDTVNVTKYIFADVSPSNFTVRKYNPVTKAYRDVPGSSLTKETIASQTALKLTYSVQDGGELDDDGDANGVIVDPVGIALSATSSANQLANTGVAVSTTLLLGLILGASIYIYVDYRKHRQPLVKEDPHVPYTFVHHVRVVTMPMLRYRLDLKLERARARVKS